MALALMSPREVLLLTVNGTHSAICKESREVSASRHSCLTDSFILQLFTRQRTLLGARQVGTQLSRNVSRSLEKLHWRSRFAAMANSQLSHCRGTWSLFIHSSYKIAQEMVESACLTTTDRRVRVGTLGLFSGHQWCFSDMTARRHRPTGVLIRSGFDFAWNRKYIIRHLMVALFLKVSL